MGTILEVPIIRVIAAFWGVSWDLCIHGNYHFSFSFFVGTMSLKFVMKASRHAVAMLVLALFVLSILILTVSTILTFLHIAIICIVPLSSLYSIFTSTLVAAWRLLWKWQQDLLSSTILQVVHGWLSKVWSLFGSLL